MSEFVKQLLIVCPLLFLAGLCDAIAGGGGTISLPALLLALFLRLGLSKPVAMLPVFAICVPVNFLLVRYFLKSKTSDYHGNQNP